MAFPCSLSHRDCLGYSWQPDTHCSTSVSGEKNEVQDHRVISSQRRTDSSETAGIFSEEEL